MNLALFAQSGIFRSLQTLVHVWTASKAQARYKVVSPAQSAQPFATTSIAPHVALTRAKAQNSLLSRPLRIVRVVEAGQSRSCVGRIVISGRMSDVCAELDRLAASEAALS
jgi:hypothetical protein